MNIMTRDNAVLLCRDELKKHGLTEWKVRCSSSDNSFLGLCSYKDKCIILNSNHLDIHSDSDVINTIKHEVAHALTPGMGHNEIWADKARSIGCDNTLPCSNLSLPPHIIDAIRSGATVEVEVEEQVIRTPKYKVTRLQDHCPECGKVAVTRAEHKYLDTEGNTVKITFLQCGHLIKVIIPAGTPFHKMVSNEWKPEVRDCKHDWNKNKCNNCGEFKPFNFQVEGMRFLESALLSSKGGGVFDEQGLGKTIQGLGYIKFTPERFPVLFILKSGLKFQFYMEVIRWLGPNYIPQVIESSKDFIIPGLKCYIVSYDLLRRLDRTKIEKLGIKTVIMDECQQIKNVDSTRTQQVRRIVNNPDIKVIALSGTPWKNRGSEFFPVLNMIEPKKFSSYEQFSRDWVDYYWEGARRKEGGIRRIEAFKSYVQNIIIRRERTEVMKELPLINRVKLHVQLENIEQKVYDEEVSSFVAWYNDFVMSGEEDKIDSLELLAKMSRMRHITGLAKIPATIAYVEEFIEEREGKIVIFVHHKDVGKILYDEMVKRYQNSDSPDYIEPIPVLVIKAELSSEERYHVQERFNLSSRAILVASTLASGEGLNLQSCSDCIMHERQWNPANEEQAEGRFIRIGQQATAVNGTYVEAEGTIDAQLDIIVENKRRAFHAAMNKGSAPIWNQGDIGKQLAEMIVKKFNESTKNKGLTKKLG
jgi:superfamily II DNA or RNA helicase